MAKKLISISIFFLLIIAVWLLLPGQRGRIEPLLIESPKLVSNKESSTTISALSNKDSLATNKITQENQEISVKRLESSSTSDTSPFTVFAYSNLSLEDDRVLLEHHQSILTAQQAVQAKLQELSSSTDIEVLQVKEIQLWADILYRDALLTRIFTEGDMNDATKAILEKVLADPSSSINLGLLEAKTSFLDGYYINNLKETLSAINQESFYELPPAKKLNLIYKIKDFLKKRKRNSDNYQVGKMRGVMLDDSNSISQKIEYLERFVELNDQPLIRYGKEYFKGLSSHRELTLEEQKSISELLNPIPKGTQ